jgi:cell division protein ZapA (FtsZ GTPase activity inhibitor)
VKQDTRGEKAGVEVRVGGRRFRVVSNGTREELERLAAMVEARIESVAPGRGGSPEALILTAMSFAADLEGAVRSAEATRLRAREVASRAVEDVAAVLAGVDAARGRNVAVRVLDPADEGGDVR